MSPICVVYDWCLFHPDAEFFTTLRLRDAQMILITHTRARQQSTNQPAETRDQRASFIFLSILLNEILNPACWLSRSVSVYYTQQCSGLSQILF